MGETTKYWIKLSLSLIAFGIVLKILLGIKIIDFGLVISGWMFLGRLVTIDDELPGGFFNPYDEAPLPKFELFGLGFTFFGLVVLKAWNFSV